MIPPKRNRKEARHYDKGLYKERHRIEKMYRWLKERRGIASRYAKRADSFLSFSMSDVSSSLIDAAL